MPADLAKLVLVLLAFQVKHLLADFFLQTEWTLAGKEASKDWLVPLAAHAGGHAVLTTGIALFVDPALWWLGLVDLVLHGTIDRSKALIGRMLTTGSRTWWRLFGIDQLLHSVSDLGYAALLTFYSIAA